VRFIITRTIKFNKNHLQSGVGRSTIAWKSAFSINKTSNKCYEENASEDSTFYYGIICGKTLTPSFLWNIMKISPINLRYDCGRLHSVRHECKKKRSWHTENFSYIRVMCNEMYNKMCNEMCNEM